MFTSTHILCVVVLQIQCTQQKQKPRDTNFSILFVFSCLDTAFHISMSYILYKQQQPLDTVYPSMKRERPLLRETLFCNINICAVLLTLWVTTEVNTPLSDCTRWQHWCPAISTNVIKFAFCHCRSLTQVKSVPLPLL